VVKQWLVAAGAVVLVACSTPARRDGGSEACTAVPFPFAPVYGVVGEAMVVTLPDGPGGQSCSVTGELSLPNGDTQPITVSTTFIDSNGMSSRKSAVSLTPTSAGEWSVHLTWTGAGAPSEQFLAFPVFEPAASATPITQTFVDRMDTCTDGVRRTLSGLVLCERGQDTWVYAADGGVTSFTGVGLRVLGDEVWTLVASDVQHRTDVGGTLRFDGTVTVDLSGQVTELEPGKYIRSSLTGLVTVRWDGGVLTAEQGNEPLAELSATDAGWWNVRGCNIRPGCQQAMCPPVVTCPEFALPDLTLPAPDAIWGIVSQSGPDFVQPVFRMVPRPMSAISQGTTTDFFVPRLANTDAPFGFVSGPPGAPFFATGKHLLLARRDGTRIALSALPWDRRVFLVTREWIAGPGADPFTVVFVRTP
jgi:hypothetical protein